jgi:hypothetical protein
VLVVQCTADSPRKEWETDARIIEKHGQLMTLHSNSEMYTQ